MNKSKLKNYAPKARREFIQAVKDRAAVYGLTKKKTEEAKVSGDFVIIAGKPFPKAVADQREALEERIQRSSFDQAMEEIAYTWFNRFVAIRYMELHGYLSHGYRVLSHPDPDSPVPEILEKAVHVDLQGLNKDKVVQLKVDGTKDEELYRMLLIAQCNELYRWMPFLFENIRDCTELLLPDNLLHSDSLIRKLIDEIDEVDWQEVEIIGWLYQFYISEKKDQVIGSVVESEDIPAATQLFTPKWIVKYMVQNSLGAQWMRTCLNSPLKEKMEYYIEAAEQTEEVKKQLAEITPESLNPEELTLLDPACGSGHILVEAYDLLKEIYLERGYRKRDIPELILEKNLFGLEIDDRAAQLAGFAVMMKARADHRSIFEKGIVPNVVSIQESKGLDVDDIVTAINEPLTSKDVTASPKSMEELQDSIEVPLFVRNSSTRTRLEPEERLTVDDLKILLRLFENGKTFGSLIRIPKELAERLPAMANRVDKAISSGQPYAQAQASRVIPFIRQALILASQFSVVVANPPYCGTRYMNRLLGEFAKDNYPDSKSDMFTMFVERILEFLDDYRFCGLVCPYVWMYISTFHRFRLNLLASGSLSSLIRLEYNAFEPACVPVATWILAKKQPGIGVFIDLSEFKGHESQSPRTLDAIKDFSCRYRYHADTKDFMDIPGSPIAYEAGPRTRAIFKQGQNIGDVSDFTGSANKTAKNDLYVRLFWEVSRLDIGKGRRWVFYSKGGGQRKWYGLLTSVVDWSKEARAFYRDNKTSNLLSEEFWYRNGICYSMLTSNTSTFRILPEGCVYDMGGPAFHPHEDSYDLALLACNTSIAATVFRILNPTLNLQVSDVKNLPLPSSTKLRDSGHSMAMRLVELSKADWDSIEISWGFSKSPLVAEDKSSIEEALIAYLERCRRIVADVKELEEENNRLAIEACDLRDEIESEVSKSQITVFANPKYRYGGTFSEIDGEARLRGDTVEEFLSYAVGCMMGRYSLDEPDLIYANSGNDGFDCDRYQKFPADADGIVPLTDRYWFDDDVSERFFSFVGTVWSKETLEEDLEFIAESIGRKSKETSREAIRRYFVNDFFKDHLKRYKKRPIYWLFSSGKQKALQCLVYLHRYNEGTLSRMRTEYLIPLQGRISSKIESLEKDMEHASSTSAANKMRKEITKLEKQAEELRKYDEKLRHYADMKIKLDLDDGVKVNYGKFGDLLAEVKTVTGKKA